MEDNRSVRDMLLPPGRGTPVLAGAMYSQMPGGGEATPVSSSHAPERVASAQEATSQPEHHDKIARWKKALAGIAIVAAGASYVGWQVNSAFDKRHNHQELIKQADVDERNLFAGYQNNKLNTAASVMILHAGVKLRSTPVGIDSKYKGFAPGNLVEEIPEGKEVVAVAGAWKVDDNGTWVAVKLGKPAIPTAHVKDLSPTAIANKYVWFNYGEVQGQQNDSGEDFVTVYPYDQSKPLRPTDSARMDGAGNITDVTVNKPAGYGLKYSEGQVEDILNIFGSTTPLLAPVPTTPAPTNTK